MCHNNASKAVKTGTTLWQNQIVHLCQQHKSYDAYPLPAKAIRESSPSWDEVELNNSRCCGVNKFAATARSSDRATVNGNAAETLTSAIAATESARKRPRSCETVTQPTPSDAATRLIGVVQVVLTNSFGQMKQKNRLTNNTQQDNPIVSTSRCMLTPT